MTQDLEDAVVILCAAYGRANIDRTYSIEQVNKVRTILHHAIRHLAYPDRDVYPKTRRGTKGAPIVRR